METARVPRISILLGQGCGGAALALLPADRVIAAEHAWLSPLPPEGASVIVHRDLAHAAELAGRQRIRAIDLLHDQVVDTVVPEPDADGYGAQSLIRAIAEACAHELHALTVS